MGALRNRAPDIRKAHAARPHGLRGVGFRYCYAPQQKRRPQAEFTGRS